MPVRFATVDDIPVLAALGKRMHAITRFQRFAYHDERVANSLKEALEKKGKGRYVCLVAEDNDMGGYGVRMLKAFEQWWRTEKSRRSLSASTAEWRRKRWESLPGKMGFEKVGENFVKGMS